MGKVHALTTKYSTVVNCIKTDVHISDPFTSTTVDTLGLWDTGATNSVITKSTAQKLGLIPISKTVVNGVHGPKDVNVYYVQITLNNEQITLKTKVTECEELSANGDTGCLIGMNIISQGDFSITNFGGQTVMSFRVPSQQTIDYVEGIKAHTPLVSAKVPGRNDPCSCGSGRKYKHCCGK